MKYDEQLREKYRRKKKNDLLLFESEGGRRTITRDKLSLKKDKSQSRGKRIPRTPRGIIGTTREKCDQRREKKKKDGNTNSNRNRA